MQALRERLADSTEREWQRLASTPIARIEYLITSHCLKRYLPSSGLVLDAGCGPGRYAVDLVKKGYRVILFDLMHDYLRFARAKVMETDVEEGTAAPVEGDSYDSFVCEAEKAGDTLFLFLLRELCNPRDPCTAAEADARLGSAIRDLEDVREMLAPDR